MAFWYMKHDSPPRADDYHLSHRALLRERLSQEIEVCFKLGTDATAIIPPKRKRDLSVERYSKRKALTGPDDRPRKAQDPKYRKFPELHFVFFAMQRCRNMLKGNKCTNLDKYRYKKVSYGHTSMKHSSNEEPPQKQPREDATSHPNFGSVSRNSQVLQSGDGHQSGRSQHTPEVPAFTTCMKSSMAYSCNNQSMAYHDRQSPQWPLPEHQRSSARPLIQSSRFTPEVSTPIPCWRQMEIERMKREVQQERQLGARLTKRGLDNNFFVSRTDLQLHHYLKNLDRLYYCI